jgi:hypothetical protein
MSRYYKNSESKNANEKLNEELEIQDDSNPNDSQTEKANKEIMDRLESGEPSKGVDPDHYFANIENSHVTKGKNKKRE